MRNQRRKLKKKNTKFKGQQNKIPAQPISPLICLVEGPPGLEEISQREIDISGGKDLRWIKPVSAGLNSAEEALTFEWSGDLQRLNHLKTVHAVYTIQQHPVPRPKALLGHQHFYRLLDQIETVRAIWPSSTFQTLYISAAGSDSSIMERLKTELTKATGLEIGSHEGDLLLRIRRPPDGSSGWQTLVRTSPRPLSTRDWRVCNYEGALNAAVAQAMCLLTKPEPNDTYINLTCGSGTLIIERASSGSYHQQIGIDLDPIALQCTYQNWISAGSPPGIQCLQADVCHVPLKNGSATALTADLPFGHLVGSHETNLELYPKILTEAARLATPGANFVLITHEVRLMENLLANSPHWATLQVHKVWLGGLNPRIFVLKRY